MNVKRRNTKRKLKLLTKLQKASAIELKDEVLNLNGWNQRFNCVAHLRYAIKSSVKQRARASLFLVVKVIRAKVETR